MIFKWSNILISHAAAQNYYKFKGLKKHKFRGLKKTQTQIWPAVLRSEVRQESDQVKNEHVSKAVIFWKL